MEVSARGATATVDYLQEEHTMLQMLTPAMVWFQARHARMSKGASLVEYALLVVLIAIVAIVAVRFAGTQVSGTFDTIGNELAGTAAP